MISTLDGAIAVQGRSGMLGGPADRRIFQTLRSLADVILVGAGTVRAEGYGPVQLDQELSQKRKERGQSVAPPVAVVTRSANLDWTLPFFTEAATPPIVLTTDDQARQSRVRLKDVAQFFGAGDDGVDVRLALRSLHAQGYRSVLLEGGPGLNAEVVQAGLLDELCLTIAPRLVGGTGPRLLAGPELPNPLNLDVVHLLEEDGFFFYRCSVRPSEAHPSQGG
jgi:riboflavin-specific deaminase-like protein